MKILVVTRSYPATDDLYQYPFVHRRVLAYRARGHEVAVFRPVGTGSSSHRYEGVTCHSGAAAELQSLTNAFRPDAIAAHGLGEQMWPVIAPLGHLPVRAWLHGSEIGEFFRRKADFIDDKAARSRALADVEKRARFWRELVRDWPADLKLVFPSEAAVEMMREDVGNGLRDHAVLPNPIDTDLFGYRPKSDDDRFRVLSIRPYDSRSYANDLAVDAVLHLASQPGFERFRFTFIGDGPLFGETLGPVQHLANVTIRRQFLTQREIADEHQRHGVFLVPTRLDTQGVSRDEAMSSGLVPVTNSLAVVREFVDEACSGLARPGDALGLSEELMRMAESPSLFRARSLAAAERVRRQSGHEDIIPKELELLATP